MRHEHIELKEATPLLESKKCKLLSLSLAFFLEYATLFFTLAAWYFYDLFFAVLTLVLLFIVMGIIRSKIRNGAIPIEQREFHYGDKEIAAWFSARRLCPHDVLIK